MSSEALCNLRAMLSGYNIILEACLINHKITPRKENSSEETNERLEKNVKFIELTSGIPFVLKSMTDYDVTIVNSVDETEIALPIDAFKRNFYNCKLAEKIGEHTFYAINENGEKIFSFSNDAQEGFVKYTSCDVLFEYNRTVYTEEGVPVYAIHCNYDRQSGTMKCKETYDYRTSTISNIFYNSKGKAFVKYVYDMETSEIIKKTEYKNGEPVQTTLYSDFVNM